MSESCDSLGKFRAMGLQCETVQRLRGVLVDPGTDSDQLSEGESIAFGQYGVDESLDRHRYKPVSRRDIGLRPMPSCQRPR
ncbi:MAG: hypothetical protein M3548_08425 [Actinomycetota bacterium]|nr:hypothetical protein [Actinomycetota bacterium]